MIKRKINVLAHNAVSAKTIKGLILAVPLIWMLFSAIHDGAFHPEEMLDVKILISFVFIALCELLAEVVIILIELFTEDATKTTEDYKSIVEKYSVDKSRMATSPNESVVYPVIVDYQRLKSQTPNWTLTKSDQPYTPPKQIADNATKILKAHSRSVIYNNINIRADDFHVDKADTDTPEIHMQYSFTTYFDSLLTNRAMDYPFQKNTTIRETFEPGPFIHPLNESKMSNHLGFNGFIKTSDNRIIFVLRNRNVSTAKKRWSPSVSASLKTAHAINETHELTMERIDSAIKKEIADELKIANTTEHQIIGFYRDLVEGGKPHFVFYAKYDKTFKEFETLAKNSSTVITEKASDKRREKVKADGDTYEAFTIEQLRNATFNIDHIKIGPEVYRMNPSFIAALTMLLKYMK